MMRIASKCFAVAFLVSLTQAIPLSSSNDPFALSRVRRDNLQINDGLPDDIIPVSYEIKLNPDFDGDNITLNGNLKINIIVKKSTNEIIMNAKNLTINSDADLKCNHPTGNVVISTIEPINHTTESFKIILSKKLYVGASCSLRLNYTSEDGSIGLSRQRYTYKNGTKKFVLMNRSEIRKVFPCWDYPSFRANFIISIEHKKNYIALSNMNAVKHDINPQNPERIITHFSKSIKMDPSQVVFVIGDFIKNDDHNDKFRIWTPRGYLPNVDYAQKVGPKLLRSLDNYTDFPYETHGMKKIDLIITKFEEENFKALENWGLIRLKKHAIVGRENSSSHRRIEMVTQTMAHELAHQWFGSLINSASDRYLWITEGVANYLQYVISDEVQPTWRIMDKFVTRNIQSKAFIHDSETNSHPMEWYKADSFNRIVYEKSGAVIRMISFILGEEKFKTALKNYVKTKAFGLATSDDLFKEFTNVYTGNVNLMNVFKNWVTTPGYAVITVKRDYDAGKAIITQSRFLSDTNQTSNEKYWIPINFVAKENLNFMDTNVTHWFDPSKDSIEINQLKKDQFLLINKQQFGFYRVNYDIQNWKLIINYLNSENYYHIHVLNRAQLIDDAFNLAKVGQLDTKVVLSLLSYLKRETDIIPWSVAWKVFEEMYNIVGNTEIEKYFKKYVLDLSEKLEREILSDQFYKTDVMAADKRMTSLKETCSFGSSLCTSKAMNMLYNWLDDPQTHPLSSDEKTWVICAGLQNADQTLWDKSWDTYWSTIDFNIILGLGCPSDNKLLERFFNKSLTKEPTFIRLVATLMLTTGNKLNGVTVALDYINHHYNEIIALDGYTNDDFQFELENLAMRIKNKVQRDKLKIFLDANKASIKHADDIISAVDKQLKNIDNLLHDYKDFFEENIINNSDSFSLGKIAPDNYDEK